MVAMAIAYLINGDYEQTLQYMTMAERAMPHLLWVAFANRVAALALLGRDEEARQARDDLLARHPAASISNVPKGYDDKLRTKLVEGLRKAGFPE